MLPGDGRPVEDGELEGDGDADAAELLGDGDGDGDVDGDEVGLEVDGAAGLLEGTGGLPPDDWLTSDGGVGLTNM